MVNIIAKICFYFVNWQIFNWQIFAVVSIMRLFMVFGTSILRNLTAKCRLLTVI